MPRLAHYRKRLLIYCIYVLFFWCALIYINGKSKTPAIPDNTRKQIEDTEKNGGPDWRERSLSSMSAEKEARERKQLLRIDHGNNKTLSSLNSSETKRLELSDFLRRQPIQGVRLASYNGLMEFVEPASCTPIPTTLVLYNRIFKTGSETMGTQFQLVAGMMGYVYTKQTTEDFYDRGISEPYPMIIEHGASIVRRQIFFNAHFYFRNDLKLQRTHTYINQVREPVARYISHYAYMHNARHRPPERVQEMIESGEWNDTIEECFEKEGQGCKHNIMTRFFCGPASFCKNNPKKALKRAKENIVKYYAVVGLLEHFDLTLKIIQKRLPSFLPVIPRDPGLRENQAKKTNASTVSEEMIAKIKKANWADIELYALVKKLFWRQVKACEIPETGW